MGIRKTIAHRTTLDEIRDHVDADTLHSPLDRMMRAIGRQNSYYSLFTDVSVADVAHEDGI
jgi:glutamine phosphoribosylpyrophosphate amidotransferase